MKSVFKITSPHFTFFVMLFFCSTGNGQVMSTKPSLKIVEIRTYNLKENSRDDFHRLFTEKAMPLLQKWNIKVVGYGPSLHDKTTYTLIREYQSLDQMQKSEDAFYANDEWRGGPREAILALIENYTTLVIGADQELIKQLKKSLAN